MSKQFLTDDEVMAIRMCHHDFGRLPISRAAQAMGITEDELHKLLKRAKIKAPQLFPILTEAQYQLWQDWDKAKWDQMKKDIQFLRKQGFINPRKSSPVQFDLARHEKHIKEVF